jgi:RNA polymerase-binding transcription factor DksA
MAEDDPFYVRDTIAMLRPYPADGPWAGRLSKMRILAAQIEENAAPTKDKKPALLQMIEEAVERIHAGTYEFCVVCGKRIEEDRQRIEAPWITRCQEHREKK